MSLDLFVNFERAQSNDVFYREIAINPFSCTVRLSDTEASEPQELITNYFARYSHNGAPLMDFDLLTGTRLSLERATARTHKIDVNLYSYGDPNIPAETFSMSAIFVDRVNIADFIAYPRLRIDENTGIVTELTPTNVELTNGVNFYGEGHTEKIYLSAIPFGGSVAEWYVGNSLDDLTSSEIETFEIDSTTHFVNITSTNDVSASIPITLVLKDNSIPVTPKTAYYFRDTDGKKVLYWFVASTLNVATGNENKNKTRFKENIKVKTYPSVKNNFLFKSPFEKNLISLPVNYTNSLFTGRVSGINTFGLFQKDINATTWHISTTQDTFDTQGNWFYQTTKLENIKAYEFPLAFERLYNETPEVFKVSSINDTILTVTVSADVVVSFKPIISNLELFDWKPTKRTIVFEDTAVVLSRPSIKIFSLDYYNLLDQRDVNNIYGTKFYIDKSSINDKYDIKNIKIQATNFDQVITLSATSIDRPFYINFTNTGIQTLTATTLLETKTGKRTSVTNVFPNIVEVLLEFDNVNSGSSYYKSEFTQLTLPVSSAPLITPNEWAVEDNINNSISKIYKTIDEVKTSLFRYKQNSFLYGWLGTSTYTWSDLECNENNTAKLTWDENECIPEFAKLNQDADGFPLFWNQQRLENVLKDPSCFQKYCIEWKWNRRRRRPASLTTTWSSAKQDGMYAKKWKFESCELDSIPLNCNKGSWHFSTINPEFFPIPFCSSNKNCEIISCVKLKEDSLLIAHKTELNILDNSYEPKLLHRRGIADELFNFAEIKALSLSKDKTKVYVLDSLLSKVCSYTIENNNLKLSDSWGRFGFKNDSYGFNEPTDIYLDPNSNKVIVTDKGNACLKIYSAVGFHLKTIFLDEFESNPPLSVCVDSQNLLHVLTSTEVIVMDWEGNKSFSYQLINNIVPNKIINAYNQEAIYICHTEGVQKYFRTGSFYQDILYKTICANGKELTNFNGIVQDEMRNLFISVNDKVLKMPDRMKIDVYNTVPLSEIYWKLNEIQVHKEEYIQSWVYLKAFHRLWDNIELVRTFLPFDETKNLSYLNPVYSKEQIIIGQNEIVTNSVINRCLNQLWSNIESLLLYFE